MWLKQLSPAREQASIPCLGCLHLFPDMSSCSWRSVPLGCSMESPDIIIRCILQILSPGPAALLKNAAWEHTVVFVSSSLLWFSLSWLLAFSSSSLVCPWSPRLSGRALLLFTAVTVVASPALQVSLGLIPRWLGSTLLSVTLRAVAARQVCWPGPAVVRDCACNRQLWSQTAGVRSPAPILTAPLCVRGIVSSSSLTQFPRLYNKDTNVHSLQASRILQW